MDVAAIASAVTGLAVLTGSIALARRHGVGPLEQRVFRAFNDLPDALYWPLWLPMQLGNLVVGTAVGLAIAAWYGSWHLAASVAAATAMKLVAERVVRARVAGFAASRQRPGTTEPGAILRGDVPATGASFPSGHVILVAAIACTVTAHIPAAATWVPFVLTLVVMAGRVYVGAHNPLDVTGGLGAGLVVGGLLLLVAR